MAETPEDFAATLYIGFYSRAAREIARSLRDLADKVEAKAIPGPNLRLGGGYDFEGALSDILHAMRSQQGNVSLDKLVRTAYEAANAQAANPEPFIAHREAHPS